jgi:hypothetical protein
MLLVTYICVRYNIRDSIYPLSYLYLHHIVLLVSVPFVTVSASKFKTYNSCHLATRGYADPSIGADACIQDQRCVV